MKSEKDKEIDKISNNVPKENILDSLENNITSNLNSLGMYVNYNSDKLDEHLDKNDKSLNKAMKLAQVNLVLTSFLAGLVIVYILLAP
ncbi:MAG: hypothetical protein [Bacteriophage sp.]|nr:MAG: hypothetical protein [Bacteriophage sp.]